MERRADIKRETTETKIELSINLDGKGEYRIDTSIPFFDHMLCSFTKYSLFDLELTAQGDDLHHIFEDVGISLGKGIEKALGNKQGIRRFGECILPMDEALVLIALDVSGRGFLSFNMPPLKPLWSFEEEEVEVFKEHSILFSKMFEKEKDTLPSYLKNITQEFFKSLANASCITLHINILYGEDMHHIMEAIFKGVGIAFSQAVGIDDRIIGIPSTKGVI